MLVPERRRSSSPTLSRCAHELTADCADWPDRQDPIVRGSAFWAVLTTRRQMQGEAARSAGAKPHGALVIVKQLGLTGLYKGAAACLLRDAPVRTPAVET